MRTGLFQRLFAAAQGSLGGTRVRPQAAPAWSSEGVGFEPAEIAAPAMGEPAVRAEVSEAPPPACLRAGPAQGEIRAAAVAPHRLQPLSPSAAESRHRTVESANPGRDSTEAADTPAQLRTVATAAAPVPPAEPRRLSRGSQAAVPEAVADHPPPLLQAPLTPQAGAAPPLGPAASVTRPRAGTPAAMPGDEPTVVHVSIGRVEFVAAASALTSRARATPRAAPRVPLADYLSGKSR